MIGAKAYQIVIAAHDQSEVTSIPLLVLTNIFIKKTVVVEVMVAVVIAVVGAVVRSRCNI